MEVILQGAAVAALGGLAWVAWQDPRAYSRISILLLALGVAAFVVAFVYDLGLREGRSLVVGLLKDSPPGIHDASREAFERVRLLPDRVYLWVLAGLAYLSFLGLMPWFRGLTNNPVRLPPERRDDDAGSKTPK